NGCGFCHRLRLGIHGAWTLCVCAREQRSEQEQSGNELQNILLVANKLNRIDCKHLPTQVHDTESTRTTPGFPTPQDQRSHLDNKCELSRSPAVNDRI